MQSNALLRSSGSGAPAQQCSAVRRRRAMSGAFAFFLFLQWMGFAGASCMDAD